MKRNLFFTATLILAGFIFSTKTNAQAYAPSVQASNVQVSYKFSSGTAITVTWTRGNGNYAMVSMRKASSTNYAPRHQPQ